MYCTPMFIPGSICNVIESFHAPDVPIGRFNNVNNSCKVIEGNLSYINTHVYLNLTLKNINHD